ncbi:ECF subfamily RNA polymerase sigma-70 factor [Flammeovirgaceae bacterium 311]|nr:ECF subfamily RNA polymerase sigma-70 factor [Flammeovirgaceae bacterium 311]
MGTTDITIQIQKVLAGDVAAYSNIVSLYRDLAHTLAYNILLNHEDAEEAVQDAFVKAYLKLSTFKGEAKFSTWLYRIVFTTAINKSKKKKLPLISLEDQLNDEELSPQLNSQLAAYALAEQQKFIQQAMVALKEDERVCITLFYLQEFSVSEVEELTQYTASNIKVLLHRGRKKLLVSLQQILKNDIHSLI